SPTTVTGLSSSTQYYFKVEGTNSKFGYQAANAEVSATTGPPPQTPAGLAAVGGVANVSLTWNTAIGASTYTILRSTTSGSGYTALSSCTSIATTTCTDLTALNGTSYYYVVRSEGSGLLSANSSEVSAQPISSFSISSAAVTESGGPNSLVLSWGVATGATSYSITWGTGGSATGTGSTTTPGTTATIGSLTAGTAYTFKVTATNPVGSGTSVAASSTLNGTPMTRPSITSITQTGGGQAALVWSGGSGSSSFTVKYGGSSGSYSSTASTSATSPYTLNGLTPGSLNYVMVTAVNSSGSLNANAETSINPLPAPAAPTGLTATGGTSSISIVWSASTNAATYTLYRSTVSGSGYAAVSGCTAITGLTCIDSSAPAGMNYYVVTATNIGGTSPNSAEASVNYAPVILVNFTDKDGNARSGFTLLSTTSSGAPAAVGSDLYLTKTIGSTLNNGDPTCTVTLKTYAVTAISGTHFTADTSASGAYVITMNASKKKLSPSSSLFNVTAYSGWNRDQTGTTRTDNGDRYFIARIDSTTCGTVGSSRQAQVNIVDPYYSTVNGYGGGGDFMLSESFYSASPGTGDTYAVVTVQRPLFAGSITNDSSVKVLDLWLDAGASSAQGTDYATSSPTLQYTNNYDGSTVSGGGTGIVDKSSRYVLTFNANETEKEVRIPVASSGANKSFYVRLTPHTFTANTTEGSTTLSSVSDTTDLATGQTISGPGIQGGTTITVSGATVTLSKPAAYTATGNTFQTTRAGSTRAQSIAKVRILNTNGTDTTTTPILRTASPTFYNSTASCYTGSALTPSVVSTTNGSPTLTVTSTSGYTSGMPIAGANIPAKTYVNVSNATTLTLVKEDGTNQNATGSASQTAQVWAFGGGDGTSSKPYLICNSTHWANMVHATRCSGASCNGSSLYFKLMTDFAWGSPPSQLAGFRANLDGNQYLIQGYGVNDTVVPAVNPLFSNTGSATTLSSTTLKNLNVLHSSIIYSGTSNGMGMLYSALNGTGFTFSDLFISGMMDLSGAPASNSRSGFLFGYTSAAYTGNTSMDHLMTAGTFSTRFSSNANGAGGYYSNHTPGASNQLAITNSYNTLNMLFNSSGSTYGTGGIIGQYDQASSGVTTGGINLDKIYVTGFLWNGGASTNPGLGGIIGLVTTQTSPVTIYSSSDFVNNSFTNLSFSGSLHASQSYMGGILGKVAITTGGQSFSINGNSTSGSILNQNTTGQYTGGLIGQFKNNSVATDARLYLNNNTTRNSVTLSGTGTTSYTGGLAGSLKIGNSTAGSNHTFESSNNLSTSAVTLATTSTGASGTFYVGGWVGYLYWSPTNASGVFSKNGASG
ncbi:MAG: hypothetical protein EBX52_08310, partial [Proteobacteria bacterium]|nr:hypothetical protein [Pseudomonadota bacterium]